MPTHINVITGERREYSDDEYVDFITGEIKKKKKQQQKETPQQPHQQPPQETPQEYSGKVHINPISGKRTPLRDDEEVDFITGRVVKKRPTPKQPIFEPQQHSSLTQSYSPQDYRNAFDIPIHKQPRRPKTPQEKHRIKILIALTIIIGVLYSLISYSNSNPVRFTIILSILWVVFVTLVWKSDSFNRLIRQVIPKKIQEFVKEPERR